MNKLISIVIPFYKYVNYLEDCFLSLKESSFKDFEVLLVCDEDAEDSRDLISAYSNYLQIKVISLVNASGVAAARNLGMLHATTPYIYFLDSDDYVEVNTLHNMVEVMNEQDIIYGKRAHTWNKRANYLANIETKEDDAEEIEETDQVKLTRLEKYLVPYEGTDIYEQQKLYYVQLLSRKKIGKISVLSNLYNTQFLKENNIVFDETFVYYSDVLFVLETLNHAISSTYVIDSIYVKRKHNDPINYPALSQLKDDNRFFERIRAYEQGKSLVNDKQLKDSLDSKIIKYITSAFARKLRRSKDVKWKELYFPVLVKLSKQLDKDIVASKTKFSRSLIRSLQEDNMDKTLKIIRRKLVRKKLKNIVRKKMNLYKLAYYHIFMKLPVKNKVVMFESFMGKNYSDNPKYIFEYLATHHSDSYDFVWVLNNGTKPPFPTKVVKRFSFRYAYYLAVSKYLVFNVRQPLWYRKKEGQVFVQTWHGTPLKRLVFDQEEVTSASPKYKHQFYKQRVDWDYLVSANDFSTVTLKRCFMYENEMLSYGYPRNDILYSSTIEDDMIILKNKLHIPLDKKTILYAPTWRDDEHYDKGKYKFTLQLDLDEMQKQLGEEYVVLLRMHHYISDAIDTSAYPNFVYNLSNYDDISEIYTISDLCITDYSSVFFDYANLKRPILFFTYDIEKYKNLLRGFYIDMETEVPGPLLYTSNEVIHAIANIDEISLQYATRYEEFYDRFCHLDDGNASKCIVEKVMFNK